MATIAETTAIRAYLKGDLSVGPSTANDNSRVNALMDNGLDSWPSFAELNDEEVLQLVKYVRKPGGNDEGHNIPAMALNKIQVACYAARYYDMIGRTINQTSMAWARIKHFKTLIEINKEYSEPDTIVPLSKNSKIVEWTETLEEHLSSVKGVRKIPLSYLIRENVAPGECTPYQNDYTLPYSHEYNSFAEEMIARTTHDHPSYTTDNEALYHIISNALNDTPFMTSIKRHRSRKNGRGAYMDLVTHHSGTTKWNDLASTSDKRATTLVWNGRSARYNLSNHINQLRSCHNDLLRATDHIEYAVPTETQRVERLLQSLQTSEPAIVSGITTIRGSTSDGDGLYTDFERAADFLLRVAPKQRSGNRDHNVSGVAQEDFDNFEGATSKGPKTGVELRYHTREEWKKLSKAEKSELYELRGPPGGPPGNDGNNNNKGNKRKRPGSNFSKAHKRLKKENKKLERRIAALESSEDSSAENKKKKALEKPTQRE